MMFRQIYLSLFLIAGCAYAQTQVDLRTQTKSVDFTAATYTRPLKSGSALPASCTQNEVFLLNTAPAGSNIYACLSANTWVPQNGSAPSIAIQNGGTAVGSEGTANFVPGLGVVNAITDLGAKINVQQSVDTSIVLSKAASQAGQGLLCQSSGGSASAYTCSMAPTLAAYVKGMVVNWMPDVTTDGSGATLNIDLLGAVNVTEADGATVPSVAEILAGRLYAAWYDGSVFRLLASAASGGGGGSSPVGPPNQIFATDSSGGSADTAALRSMVAADLPAGTRVRGFHVVFGGSDVASGGVIYVTMPYACNATGYALAADPSGTATVKLWKIADGSALPTSANSISTTGFVLSSGARVHSTNVADLSTVSWTAYDTTAVMLSSVSGSPNHVEFMLECDQ